MANLPTESFVQAQNEKRKLIGNKKYKKDKLKIMTEEEERADKTKCYSDLFTQQIRNGPAYKALLKGRKKKQGKSFQENMDPVLPAYIEDQRELSRTNDEYRSKTTVGKPGHMFIRMKQRYKNKLPGQYSFGFYSTGLDENTGMEAATTGIVENPDDMSAFGDAGENAAVAEKNITTPEAFNAVGYVRSVIASAWPYTLTRYSCTSFASEAARATGLSGISNSYSKMMSARGLSDKVDTPTAMTEAAGFYERRAEQIEKENEIPMDELF